MDKYTGLWRRYLCYCVRAWRLGCEGARDARGITFSDEQWAHLTAAAQRLEEDGGGDGNDGNDDNDSNNGNDSSSSEGASELDRHVRGFCIASIKQRVAYDVYVNPLLHLRPC